MCFGRLFRKWFSCVPEQLSDDENHEPQPSAVRYNSAAFDSEAHQEPRRQSSKRIVPSHGDKTGGRAPPGGLASILTSPEGLAAAQRQEQKVSKRFEVIPLPINNDDADG